MPPNEKGRVYQAGGHRRVTHARLRRRYALCGFFWGMVFVLAIVCWQKFIYWVYGP